MIQAGDLVQLKSGGPIMTVEHRINDGKLYCSWFDGTQKIGKGFAEEALELSENSKSEIKIEAPQNKKTV